MDGRKEQVRRGRNGGREVHSSKDLHDEKEEKKRGEIMGMWGGTK